MYNKISQINKSLQKGNIILKTWVYKLNERLKYNKSSRIQRLI